MSRHEEDELERSMVARALAASLGQAAAASSSTPAPAGAPPAALADLKMVKITDTQVAGEPECSICAEDFACGDEVCELP